MKYVLVTSDGSHTAGKHIIAASTGILLKALSKRVTVIRIESQKAMALLQPETKDIFVLADGTEVHSDIGEYERSLDITLTRNHIITVEQLSEQAQKHVPVDNEMDHPFQYIEGYNNDMRQLITRVAQIPVDGSRNAPQVCIIDFAGTLAELNSGDHPFELGMNGLRGSAGSGKFLHLHIINDKKTISLAEQTVITVTGEGLMIPDLLVLQSRSPYNLEDEPVGPIASVCSMNRCQVLALLGPVCPLITPIRLKEHGMLQSLQYLMSLRPKFSLVDGIPCHGTYEMIQGVDFWRSWKTATTVEGGPYDRRITNIAIVANFDDTCFKSHLAILWALKHAAMACRRHFKFNYIDASKLESTSYHFTPFEYENAWATLRASSGVLVPGGTSSHGTEGMITAIRWARESKIPFQGISLGMQLAVIEFARSVCGMRDATSAEFVKDAENTCNGENIITHMPYSYPARPGDCMRLGVQETHFQRAHPGSKIRGVYAAGTVKERYHHRFEVNPKYFNTLERHGLEIVGRDASRTRAEAVEIVDHPWFVGVQYNPEYTSTVLNPNKCLMGFFAASAGCLHKVMARDLHKQVFGCLGKTAAYSWPSRGTSRIVHRLPI